MSGRAIKFLVYAVTLCVLYAVFAYLNSRDGVSSDPSRSDVSYIVRLPAALKYVYGILFGLGILMLVVFGILRLKNTSGVTNGHLWFAVVIAAIGLFVMVLSSSWRITVNGNQMIVQKLFCQSKTIAFSEMERAELQTKRTSMGVSSRIVLYKDGKKLVTVNYLSDNYERFVNTLKSYGKL